MKKFSTVSMILCLARPSAASLRGGLMAKTAEGEMGDYPSDYTLAIPFDGCVSGEVFATDLFDGKGLGGIGFHGELEFDENCDGVGGADFKEGAQGGVHVHAGTTCASHADVSGHFCPWVETSASCLNTFGDPWYATYTIQKNEKGRLVAFFSAAVYGQLYAHPGAENDELVKVLTGFTPRAPLENKYFSVVGKKDATRPKNWQVNGHAVVVHMPTILENGAGVSGTRISCGVLEVKE